MDGNIFVKSSFNKTLSGKIDLSIYKINLFCDKKDLRIEPYSDKPALLTKPALHQTEQDE
jgi:hypothetical protein